MDITRETLLRSVLLFYILSCVVLCARLLAIRKNPEKYNVIPGYEAYKQSKYFWPHSMSYGKHEHPDRILAGTMWLIAVLPFLYIYSIHYAYSTESIQPCDTFCFVGLYGGFLQICIVFLASFVAASYLALFSKRPADICYTLFHMGHEKTRQAQWFKWTLYLLVLLLLLCPLHLYSLTHGGYVNNSELVYYDGISEKTALQFSEIESYEIIYQDSSREVIGYVIESDSGKQIDLCDSKIIFLDKTDYELWEYVDARLVK